MKTIKFKKELTIEAIVNIINEINYDESKIIRSKNSIPIVKFDIEFWNKAWERFLDEFFDSRTRNIIYDNKTINHGIVKFNEKYKDFELNDVRILNFNSLYPNIIIRLNNENKIQFNLDEYGIIYEFIVNNYNEVKNLYNEDIRMKWCSMKNAMFGCSNYFKSIVNYSQFFKNSTNNKINVVSSYMSDFFNEIYNKYEEYIISINTDQIIYFDNIPDSFYLDIDKINLKYDISDLYDGMFRNYHRFILKNKEGKIIKDTITKIKL